MDSSSKQTCFHHFLLIYLIVMHTAPCIFMLWIKSFSIIGWNTAFLFGNALSLCPVWAYARWAGNKIWFNNTKNTEAINKSQCDPAKSWPDIRPSPPSAGYNKSPSLIFSPPCHVIHQPHHPAPSWSGLVVSYMVWRPFVYWTWWWWTPGSSGWTAALTWGLQLMLRRPRSPGWRITATKQRLVRARLQISCGQWVRQERAAPQSGEQPPLGMRLMVEERGGQWKESLVEMRLLFCGGGWARQWGQLQCWLTWKCMTGCYLVGENSAQKK